MRVANHLVAAGGAAAALHRAGRGPHRAALLPLRSHSGEDRTHEAEDTVGTVAAANIPPVYACAATVRLP